MIFDKHQVLRKCIPDKIVGIYYFMDAQDNILYIGKSINIKKRIDQHFKTGRKRMLASFENLKIKKLHTELEALLLESQEIKRYTPRYNRRLRRSRNSFSIFQKVNKYSYLVYYVAETNPSSLLNFMSKRQALSFLGRLSNRFTLCEKLNGLDFSTKSCFKYQLKSCNGACVGKESVDSYNQRFEESLSSLFELPTNCNLVFREGKLETHLTISNNQLSQFGVKGKSDYPIEFSSYDEMRIIITYQKKNPKKLLSMQPHSKNTHK